MTPYPRMAAIAAALLFPTLAYSAPMPEPRTAPAFHGNIVRVQAAMKKPSRVVMTPDQVKAALADLPGWTMAENGKSISKSFEFASFNEAFGFMTRVALRAEQMDHHPDWQNLYKSVKITLNTFDVDGVTEFDTVLAKAIDNYASAK